MEANVLSWTLVLLPTGTGIDGKHTQPRVAVSSASYSRAFYLEHCSCWRSSSSTGIRGKTFAITAILNAAYKSLYEKQRQKTYLRTCAPTKSSLSVQRRLWSDYTDVMYHSADSLFVISPVSPMDVFKL